MDIKQYTFHIVMGVMFAFIFVTQTLIVNTQTDALSHLRARESELINQIDVKIATKQTASDGVVQEVSGLNSDRVAKDDAVVKDVLSLLCTWSNSSDYIKARYELVNTHGISEDSAILTDFMPEITKVPLSDGNKYEMDITGANSTYVGLDSYVAGIKGDVYSYATRVTIESSDGGGHSKQGKFLATYSVDYDGDITDLNAFTLPVR